MTEIDNQKYLKDVQYKTSANLNARIQIHRRFGTNPYPWQRWVFDQLYLQPGQRALEAGCGPGNLWLENLDRLPEGARAVLGDYSLGMAQTARSALDRHPAFAYLNLDVQHIPAADACFDRIAANHMLYHVPDLSQAVSELRRVLRSGGRLVAATNGMEHMRQITELSLRFPAPGLNMDWYNKEGLRRFSLENALEVLGEAFDEVELLIYEDDLEVTDPQAILDYIGSMTLVAGADGRPALDLDRMGEYLRGYFAEHESYHITKSQGIAVAYG